MKVLFVSELQPASDSIEITGGVEARTFYVPRGVARFHDVEVIARRTDGSRWDAASAASLHRRAWFLLTALFKGLRSKADVVDGSNLVVFPVAWLVAKVRRRPVVFWYPDVLIGHWRKGDFGIAGWLGEAIERVVLKLPVDQYIAISESTATKLVAHGVPRDRVTVIPCGFDPVTVEAALAHNERAEEPTITTVGRLVSYKRVDVVIRALALLRDPHPDLRLNVIGQGPELDPLRKLAAELGMADRVTFLGHVAAHVDVLRTVARGRLFVSASEIEGFGIAVVEAMALGIPYVVADNTAFTEVTAGGTGGALFRRGDPADLARRIDELLSDDARYSAAASAGRAFAGRYHWSDVSTSTANVFEQLVTGTAAEGS